MWGCGADWRSSWSELWKSGEGTGWSPGLVLRKGWRWDFMVENACGIQAFSRCLVRMEALASA